MQQGIPGKDDGMACRKAACVVHARGANERAVNVCKRAWFISRGFQESAYPKQLNDTWMTLSFQYNFTFKHVP